VLLLVAVLLVFPTGEMELLGVLSAGGTLVWIRTQ
jgi:hypothetical protein